MASQRKESILKKFLLTVSSLFIVTALAADTKMTGYMDRYVGFSFNYPNTWVKTYSNTPLFKDSPSSVEVSDTYIKEPRPTLEVVGGLKNDETAKSVDGHRLEVTMLDENQDPKIIDHKTNTISGVKITREIFTFKHFETGGQGVAILTNYTSSRYLHAFLLTMSTDWYSKNSVLIQNILNSYRTRENP